MKPWRNLKKNSNSLSHFYNLTDEPFHITEWLIFLDAKVILFDLLKS